jgi:hypothetical protein
MTNRSFAELYNENENSLRRFRVDEVMKSKSFQAEHGRIVRNDDLWASACDTLLAHYFYRN